MLRKGYRLGASITIIALLAGSLPSLSHANEDIERRKASVFSSNQTKSWQSSVTVNDREIIVKTKRNIKEVTDEFNLIQAETPDILSKQDLHIVSVPKKQVYNHILDKLNNADSIELAEPNYQKESLSFGFSSPNDEYFPQQWHLKQIGIPAVWEQFTPVKTGVVVAVLDSGVDYKHPDLAGQVLSGIDTYGNDNDPMDTDDHGTAVAGTIAANTNNGIGIAGINPKAKILPIRIGGKMGPQVSDAVAGIHYAIQKGADIINLSYGGTQPSKLEYDALLEAYQKGILIVAAAGNSSENQLTYPAGYPFVLSVGSTDINDNRSAFSNYGDTLDIAAPGEDVLTTLGNGKYGFGSGTSISAPIVSGAASIILSVNPRLSPLQVQYLLEKGASQKKWSNRTGYGRVDLIGTFTSELPSLNNDAGNMRKNAKMISVNKTYRDKYDFSGDTDWYVLNVKKSMKVSVHVSAVANINPVIWVDQYKNGKVIKEKQYNKSKIGKKEAFTYSLTPGAYYFEIYDNNQHWSEVPYTLKLTTMDTKAPSAPKVNKVSSKSTKVTGTAEKNSKLVLKKGKTVLEKGTTNSKGIFSFKVKKQKKGTTLYLTSTDKAGNISKATKIIVK